MPYKCTNETMVFDLLQPDKPNTGSKKRQINDDESDEEEYVDKRRRNKPPTSTGISEEDREKILQMVENEADVRET